jgi:hypothetical protein
MLPKNFRTCYLSFSTILSLLIVVGCGHGPKVSDCVHDPDMAGFQCAPPKGKTFFVPYKDAENWVAFSPTDARKLFDYMKAKCGR